MLKSKNKILPASKTYFKKKKKKKKIYINGYKIDIYKNFIVKMFTMKNI